MTSFSSIALTLPTPAKVACALAPLSDAETLSSFSTESFLRNGETSFFAAVATDGPGACLVCLDVRDCTGGPGAVSGDGGVGIVRS